MSLRPEDRLSKASFKGFEEFNGQNSFKIEFKDSTDKSVIFYYSFENYMPLGFEYPSGDENERVTTYYSDWKDLNGIKVFQKTIIKEGDIDWYYDFTDIKIDSLDDADFESKDIFITKRFIES